MSATESLPILERCVLEHRMFSTLEDVRFRRSLTDGTAMMAVSLGDREADIPLCSLRREFGIDSASPDGRVLELIGESLDFVSILQPGDRLPPEILTGEASWRPSPNHLRIASTRLRLQLVAWLMPDAAQNGQLDELALLRLADDPMLRRNVQAVISRAAQELGLSSPADVIPVGVKADPPFGVMRGPDWAANAGTVRSRLMATGMTRLLEEIAEELAYIEALRDRLLRRVESVFPEVAGLNQQRTAQIGGAETLVQVKVCAARR